MHLNVDAQKNTAAIGAAVGIAAIGTGIATVEQMKEQAELGATEWFLKNHPENDKFALKIIGFNGRKAKDLSMASVMIYKIQDYEIVEGMEQFGKKYILLAFTSHGWVNNYGINYNKLDWHLIDSNEWLNMMISYSSAASGIKDTARLRKALENGKLVNKGIKAKDKIDFYKITGDMYLVANYSDEMSLVYNERSLGIYLKKTSDLIQIKRSRIINIHNFFFHDTDIFNTIDGYNYIN
ncbi:MAG: hypothetical protein N4A49_07965 [Marinifilaceae bacterium]|nr:hypothetical protein [Marinifilaceae bacterium]